MDTFVTFNHYISPKSPVQLLTVSDVTVNGATTYNLKEYTHKRPGQYAVRTPGSGATENEDARGLSVDPSGNIEIYDGTSTPSLATLSAKPTGPIRPLPAGVPSIPTATAKSRPTITSCSLLT